jgi:uncharacterized membrane protein YdjX (TVP38/TMEM64 family)
MTSSRILNAVRTTMSARSQSSSRAPGEREHEDSADKPLSKTKIAIAVAVVLALAAAYWLLSETGTLSVLTDEQRLRGWIDQLGFWGPLAIVALMTAAIVMSPIPSGPIALAAGAAYGPLWGTVWVVIGAEAGALIAFAIARWLGYDAVRRRLKGRLAFLTKARSQTALMAIVFASRLVPFISFDAVSYAAGLTPLAFWRFAVATVIGVIPVAFLFAYFGEELVTAESQRLPIIVLLLSAITLVPIGAKLLWNWYRKRRQ